MKTIIKTLLTFFIVGLVMANAQNKSDETVIRNIFENMYEIFDAGQYEKGMAFYTENAVEIGPDGSIVTGKKAMLENFLGFVKMLDSKPKFTYSNLNIRFIKSDIAITTWEQVVVANMEGQPIGGNMKCLGVLNKINGKWLMEADAVVVEMPTPPSSAKN